MSRTSIPEKFSGVGVDDSILRVVETVSAVEPAQRNLSPGLAVCQLCPTCLCTYNKEMKNKSWVGF